MRFLIIMLMTLANLAVAAQPEKVIDVQHDAHRGATCWILNDTAISCLPDSQLQRQPNVTPSHIKESPAPASAPAPRQSDERFQL